MKHLLKEIIKNSCILVFLFGSTQVFSQKIKVPIANSLTDWSYPLIPNTTPSGGRYIWVAPNGNGNSNGSSEGNPTTLAKASASVKKGDVVYLKAGTYQIGKWEVSNKYGSSSQPIIFRSAPGQVRKAIIKQTAEDYIARFKNVSYLTVMGLVFDGSGRSVWGITTGRRYNGDPDLGTTDHFRFIANEVKNVRKEYSVNISRSTNAEVIGNYIHDAGSPGQKQGEGIYVGCGACRASENTSNGILIEGNKVERFGAEAIDIKDGVVNITVINNLIYNGGYNMIYGGSQCCFGGAITAGGDERDLGKANNYVFLNNRIGRVTNNGLAIGTGNAVVENNLVWETGYKVANLRTARANPKHAFSLIQNFSSTYRNVGLINNHAAKVLGPLNTNDYYNNPPRNGKRRGYQSKANVIRNEIKVHGTVSAAFTAWKKGLGTVDPDPDPDTGGDINVSVRAKGLSKKEKLILMDGSEVLVRWTINSTSLSNFSAKIKKPKGSSLQLFYDGTSDVQVDYLKIQDKIYQAEEYTNTASWSSDGGCGSIKDEWMYCDGAIFFTDIKITDPKTTSEIKVKANGNVGTEDMTIVFNNKITKSFTNVSKAGKMYSFIIDVPSVTAMRMEFPGSGPASEDLTVDYISIDDKIYQTEDQTDNIGTWIEGKGCQNNRGETLHCPGRVVYDLSGAKNAGSLLTSSNTIFEVYPNPANGNFTIQGNGLFSYHIYNVNGSDIKKAAAIDKAEVSTQDLNSGMYLVKIHNKNQTVTRKVIIEHK